MARRHTLVIAALLAFAVVGGSVALGRTLGLGAASTKANDAVVIARTRRLDQFEVSLRKQLAKVPDMPKANSDVPTARSGVPTASSGPTVSGTAPPRAQRIVYVRPKPIIVTKHRPGGAYEHEGPDQEGADYGEGGGDD